MNIPPIPGVYEVWRQQYDEPPMLVFRLFQYRDVLAYLEHRALREVQNGFSVTQSQGGFSAALPYLGGKRYSSYVQYWFDVVMDDDVQISNDLKDRLAVASATAACEVRSRKRGVEP